MVRLYLDIETYRERDEDAFVNEKVIVIGVIEDWTKYGGKSLGSPGSMEGKVEFVHFAEWELGSEEKVIGEFYDYLEDIRESSNFLVMVSFNILCFDIPLLIQKAVRYGKNLAEINKLWHEIFAIDLFQVTLPLNGMAFKGHSLESLARLFRSKGFDVPEPVGSGSDVAKWYREGKRDEIINHLKMDLEVVRHIDLAVMSRFHEYEELRKAMLSIIQSPGLNC